MEVKMLHKIFVAWCAPRGERPWSDRALVWGMKERGYALGKSPGIGPASS